MTTIYKYFMFPKYSCIFPEPTARSAVRRGLLIPRGYLHPGKCEHSEVQSHPPCQISKIWQTT